MLSGEHTVSATWQSSVGRFTGGGQSQSLVSPQLFSIEIHWNVPGKVSLADHLHDNVLQGATVVQGSSPSGFCVVVVVVDGGSLGSSGCPVGTEILLQRVEVHSNAVFLHRSSTSYSGLSGALHSHPHMQFLA